MQIRKSKLEIQNLALNEAEGSKLATRHSSRITHYASRALLLTLLLLPFTFTRAHAAVTVSSFKAQAQAAKIEVTWTTASEINNVGFNLLRGNSAAGTFAKINANLIPTQCLGCIAGSSYSYSDSSVASGQTYFYKLQSVDNGGGTQLFGPASAAVSAPTATSTATATRSPTGTPSPTWVASSTPTFTPVPGTPTRAATITPAQFTPTRAATITPAQFTPTRTAIAPKVASALLPASPTVDRQTTRGQTVPTALPTQIAPALAASVNPTVEPAPEEDLPEDRVATLASNDMDLRPIIRLATWGLSGLLGLGSVVFAALGVYLFARGQSRQ